jgi:hypothetical protein
MDLKVADAAGGHSTVRAGATASSVHIEDLTTREADATEMA